MGPRTPLEFVVQDTPVAMRALDAILEEVADGIQLFIQQLTRLRDEVRDIAVAVGVHGDEDSQAKPALQESARAPGLSLTGSTGMNRRRSRRRSWSLPNGGKTWGAARGIPMQPLLPGVVRRRLS